MTTPPGTDTVVSYKPVSKQSARLISWLIAPPKQPQRQSCCSDRPPTNKQATRRKQSCHSLPDQSPRLPARFPPKKHKMCAGKPRQAVLTQPPKLSPSTDRCNHKSQAAAN